MAGLCLGTVQFGMEYGINNTLGQPSEEHVFEMLDTAIENGIYMFDTARAYGTAEAVLGRYFESRKNRDSVEVISKLRPNVIEENGADVYSTIRREFEESLKRLHTDYLEGYLLHTPEYIYQPQIVKGLRRLKEEKLVGHIGVSIYGIQEGYAALQREGIDYIQLPYSILDQRGMQEGFIHEAKAAGVTIFTRSAFLQGLFMMDKERIPPHLQGVAPYLSRFGELLSQYNVDCVTALVSFVKQEKDIDYLVFGVDTKEQLLQDIAVWERKGIPEGLMEKLKETFSDIEKSLILPSLWSNGKKAE